MKKAQSNPIATIGGILVLTVIGLSAKHCMRKYGKVKKGLR